MSHDRICVPNERRACLLSFRMLNKLNKVNIFLYLNRILVYEKTRYKSRYKLATRLLVQALNAPTVRLVLLHNVCGFVTRLAIKGEMRTVSVCLSVSLSVSMCVCVSLQTKVYILQTSFGQC